MTEMPNDKNESSNNRVAERKPIGKTSSPEISPNTVDEFSFWIAPDRILNPFDFVSVDHVFDTRTVGVVKEMSAITDANTTMSCISNHF